MIANRLINATNSAYICAVFSNVGEGIEKTWQTILKRGVPLALAVLFSC
jgi:hypothetical protein